MTFRKRVREFMGRLSNCETHGHDYTLTDEFREIHRQSRDYCVVIEKNRRTDCGPVTEYTQDKARSVDVDAIFGVGVKECRYCGDEKRNTEPVAFVPALSESDLDEPVADLRDWIRQEEGSELYGTDRVKGVHLRGVHNGDS